MTTKESGLKMPSLVLIPFTYLGKSPGKDITSGGPRSVKRKTPFSYGTSAISSFTVSSFKQASNETRISTK